MTFDNFNKFDFTYTFFSFFSPSPPFSYYTERKLFLKTIDTVFNCKMNLSFSVLGKDHRDHLLPHIKESNNQSSKFSYLLIQIDSDCSVSAVKIK